MTDFVRSQQVNELPKVLGIPSDMDRTCHTIMQQMRDLAPTRALRDTSINVPQWIRKNLYLDEAAFNGLDLQIVKTLDKGEFDIHLILFQSQEDVYLTGNLYVPKGAGPFPAVINSHGHWPEGKQGAIVQQTAQLLARNGYVCLNIDAWGAGERGTNHVHEYHGASLGSSLLDVGIPLMGMQLLDNQSAIDLLQSLPYVDPNKIGATGASGGGNQTLWLTALDSRIKAAVPVVSVGTFESYVMNSNCVCELHPKGLLDLEKADVIASMAPRAVKIITALRDGNAAFNVQEMLKTYEKAKNTYEEALCGEHLTYELFDEKHDYTRQMQISMLTWFNQHLKQRQQDFVDSSFSAINPKELTVGVSSDVRDKITTTLSYVGRRSRSSQKTLMQCAETDVHAKTEQLKNNLLNYRPLSIEQIDLLPTQSGYERIVLTASDRRLVPILLKAPSQQPKVLRVVFPAGGVSAVSAGRIAKLNEEQEGVVLVDLFGLGERSSSSGDKIDGALPRFHTLSRSLLWMGESMMGTWASEIKLVMTYLQERFPHTTLQIEGDRETALASVVYSVVDQYSGPLFLREMPLSYVSDGGDPMGKQGLNMAMHIPGIISWGDVTGLLGLSPAEIYLEGMVSMSGRTLDEKVVQTHVAQIEKLKTKVGNTSKVHFK